MSIRVAMIVTLLFLALFVVGLAYAGTVPPFPYHRYAEIPGVTPVGPTCPLGNVMSLDSTEYRILTTQDKDIFIHKVGEQEVDYVYFAKGTGQDGIIHIIHAYTLEEAKAAYPSGPCGYFDEVEASIR